MPLHSQVKRRLFLGAASRSLNDVLGRRVLGRDEIAIATLTNDGHANVVGDVVAAFV